MPSKRQKRELARKLQRREEAVAKNAALEAARQAATSGTASKPGMHLVVIGANRAAHPSCCSAGLESPPPSADASRDLVMIDAPAAASSPSAGANSGASF